MNDLTEDQATEYMQYLLDGLRATRIERQVRELHRKIAQQEPDARKRRMDPKLAWKKANGWL